MPGLGRINIEPRDMGGSVVFYPAVGVCIGGMVYAISLADFFTPLFISIVVCVFLLVITRGVHADGLIDTFDGFLASGKTRNQVLGIMKDSGAGALGVAAAFCVYLLKIGLVYELVQTGRGGVFLVVFPVMSRAGVAAAGWLFPYAGRPGSMGECFLSSIKARHVLLSAAFMEVIFLLTGIPLLLVLGAASLFFWVCWGFLCMARIGGVTGDTTGAGVEICEVFSLAVLLLLAFSM